MTETWWDYVQRTSGHATNKEIADLAGCNPSTVSHWKNGERRHSRLTGHFRSIECSFRVAFGWNLGSLVPMRVTRHTM